MPHRTLATLALATLLGAASGHAQAAVRPADGALIGSPAGARATPATVTVMTLQWTEISVPARLLAAAGSSAPSGHRPGRFILTWQDTPAGAAEPASLAVEPRGCTVMRLVTVPCD